MSSPILATKLYIPPARPELVPRPRLLERLNEGLAAGRKLALISASAGFGKTTLVSEWISTLTPAPSTLTGTHPSGRGPGVRVAWFSLDEGDNDPSRFLAYLIAALQTIAPKIGEGILVALESPQPPPSEALLTTLLNEIAVIPDKFILVLDDYHAIDSKPIDHALAFLLEHLPPHMHLVIATREDPHLPLARLRARGQLTELRAADLRFTPAEAAEFLNQAMSLNLSAEDIAALETRTEGWIAGLQLAALALQGLSLPGTVSMPGHPDAAGFIKSFTGSHHFVLDYLIQEVLGQQSGSIQTFLLRTSILERMCGPLCDAVCSAGTALHADAGLHPTPSASGQAILEYLERANLFVVPLDNERRWYRYHHLFADLLRQRLHQSAVSSLGDEGRGVAELHSRASQWYEDNDLEIEAFHHAVAANDVERAVRLVEGKGMPLQFRGAVAPVLHWLESLPATVLDAWPLLWTTYASVTLVSGQQAGVEQKLQAAEAALLAHKQGAEPDDKTRDIIGRVAAIRATLAATLNQVETVIAQSRRAMEYLHPDNLSFRTFTIWKLGYAYHIQGDRLAASQSYTEAISISQASGNMITTIVATIGLGVLQEADNQLYLAAQTYRRVLQLFGDQPLPVACEAHLGLARIGYQWNDLDAADQHGLLALQLARQSENTDRSVSCDVFLARLKLAQGDIAEAAALLAKAGQSARQHNFVHRMPDIAAAQVLTMLQQGDLSAAAHLAQTYQLPLSQARVHLAQGDASAALAALEPFRQQMEAKGWADELLEAMVLQAVALQAHGEKDRAVQLLGEALALAEPGGFIRIFLDEGPPMARLLSEAASRGIMPDYIAKLLAAFEPEHRKSEDKSYLPPAQPLIEPLSQRELEVLQLIARGFSNREISERLFLALNTVKGHNRKIFDKLQVQNRTEAVARARQLGLL